MRLAFSLLLIPVVLVSQGFCFAHTHQGTGVAAPDGHSSRPHFHVHGVDGHHHHDADADHDDPSPRLSEPLGSHDADAVYCPTSVAFGVGRHAVSALAVQQLFDVPFLWAIGTADVAAVSRGNSRSQPPPLWHSRCPIYLRTLSLRI